MLILTPAQSLRSNERFCMFVRDLNDSGHPTYAEIALRRYKARSN